MGKCLFMRKGETHTAPVPYKTNFADNTWEQIIDACQKNAVPDTWLVGDQKAMNINGTDYAIDIIGKNHDDYYDGSGKAPLTFQMHDCYATGYKMNGSSTNSGGWSGCEMRTTHLPSILNTMPINVCNGIKEVSKLSGTGGGSSSGVQKTNDKLFLLSEIEIFGTTSLSVSGEGIQYDYYKAGNSKIKKRTTNAVVWGERSPSSGETYIFCAVTTTGTATHMSAVQTLSVSFAFCF